MAYEMHLIRDYVINDIMVFLKKRQPQAAFFIKGYFT